MARRSVSAMEIPPRAGRGSCVPARPNVQSARTPARGGGSALGGPWSACYRRAVPHLPRDIVLEAVRRRLAHVERGARPSRRRPVALPPPPISLDTDLG